MSFVSLHFIIFLVTILSCYFLLSHRFQNLLLLAGSYFFYGWWDWRFLSLLFFSTVVDFFCGQYLDKHIHPNLSEKLRKIVLLITLIVNLGMLGFFKYFDFFIESFSVLLSSLGLHTSHYTLNIILPLGISFYTFQTLSYSIDIYRGKLKSTSRFIDYMLYVSFFPQLVAGPIERAAHLFPQILKKRAFDQVMFLTGIQLAFWGFFKKIVIADNLALIVDPVFASSDPTGSAIVLASYAFAFQIYCDFSGYTDIARGVARMLGFDLMQNFKLPYFATNPRDFWQRWHISLSSWLKDYLYISMGGNRRGKLLTYRNLMLTMIIGGLWHGASWNFILWGFYHGIILCLFSLLYPRNNAKLVTSITRRSPKFWIAAILFFQVTCVGWLIFRVNDISQIAILFENVLLSTTIQGFISLPLKECMLLIVPLVLFQIYQHLKGLEPWICWPMYIKAPFYCTLLYLMIIYGNPLPQQQFIYFQF